MSLTVTNEVVQKKRRGPIWDLAERVWVVAPWPYMASLERSIVIMRLIAFT
jgi:hypothetical protein